MPVEISVEAFYQLTVELKKPIGTLPLKKD